MRSPSLSASARHTSNIAQAQPAQQRERNTGRTTLTNWLVPAPRRGWRLANDRKVERHERMAPVGEPCSDRTGTTCVTGCVNGAPARSRPRPPMYRPGPYRVGGREHWTPTNTCIGRSERVEALPRSREARPRARRRECRQVRRREEGRHHTSPPPFALSSPPPPPQRDAAYETCVAAPPESRKDSWHDRRWRLPAGATRSTRRLHSQRHDDVGGQVRLPLLRTRRA